MSIFINNKYTKWYNNIILKAQQRPKPDIYTEKHHIIPKSLGGDNSYINLVHLTAREHFICHWLLTKMLIGKDKARMTYAFWFMHICGKYKYTSLTYEKIKILHSQAVSKRMKKIASTPEWRKRASQNGKKNKGIKRPEVSARMMGIKKPEHSAKLKGRIVPDERKRNISIALKGKPWSKAKRESQIESSKRLKDRPLTKAQIAAHEVMRGKPWTAAKRIAYEAAKKKKLIK